MSGLLDRAIEAVKNRYSEIDAAVNEALAPTTTPIAPTFPTGKGNSAGKKKNKQYAADKKKLDEMSSADIEKLRTKLREERLAKEAIKKKDKLFN